MPHDSDSALDEKANASPNPQHALDHASLRSSPPSKRSKNLRGYVSFHYPKMEILERLNGQTTMLALVAVKISLPLEKSACGAYSQPCIAAKRESWGTNQKLTDQSNRTLYFEFSVHRLDVTFLFA